MKSRLACAIILLASAALSGNVLAAAPNSEPPKWDLPDKVQLETAKNEDNGFFITDASVQWTSDQLREYPDGKGFFAGLKYRTENTDQLQPLLLMSNLPGAKFTRIAASGGRGEEVKLSVLNPAELDGDKPYRFFAGWSYSGDDNPLVSLSSYQGFNQPAQTGTVNELPQTNHTLSAALWSDAKPSDSLKLTQETLSLFKENPFRLPKSTEAPLPKMKSYAEIDSKQALEQYKREAARRLKLASESSEVHFAVTFGKPVSLESLKHMADDYDLTITQFYAAATTEKGEEYTVSWFDPNPFRPVLFSPRGFVSMMPTELEGTARVEDLQRLSSSEPSVDTVDLEQHRILPTGIYWLNRHFSK
jgi:hypothetical protein